MKNRISKLLPVGDIMMAPFVYPAAWLLKIIRRTGVHRLPFCKRVLLNVGVFPIRKHYYEPQFDYRSHKKDFFSNRKLEGTGINWNINKQLNLLETFVFTHELADISLEKTADLQFHMNNGAFASGDAEYWYQLIRSIKPQRIIEIGSGHSTLMAIRAISQNRVDDPDYACEHICIEPYEMPWLEEAGVSVVRSKVEDVGLSFFERLKDNDILFIDSSHIIRPQGDVLFEFLELLPSLRKGVIVHIHDIFSPEDYPSQWLQDEVRFWNEQYLLEAFLTHNNCWQILGALNYLHHNHFDKLKAIAPFLSPDREPGSFYIQKIV